MEDDFTADADREPQGDRPKRIPKARIENLELGGKTVNIYYRRKNDKALAPLIERFPREAAMVFCDAIHKTLLDGGSYFVVKRGDHGAYREIFKWIKDCADQKSELKFPDVLEPEDDPYHNLLNIMDAANLLGIPDGSLNTHLKKRLMFLTRKHLMSLARVRDFYTPGTVFNKMGLQDVACNSIFQAWWDWKLDEKENIEYTIELSFLREDIKELDDDLHAAVVAKDEDIKRRREEKRAKALAEADGGDGFEASGGAEAIAWASTNDAVGTTGTWDSIGSEMTAGASTWDSGTISTPADWENTGIFTNNIGEKWSGNPENDGGTGNSWADEVNDQEAPLVTQFQPATMPNVAW